MKAKIAILILVVLGAFAYWLLSPKRTKVHPKQEMQKWAIIQAKAKSEVEKDVQRGIFKQKIIVDLRGVISVSKSTIEDCKDTILGKYGVEIEPMLYLTDEDIEKEFEESMRIPLYNEVSSLKILERDGDLKRLEAAYFFLGQAQAKDDVSHGKFVIKSIGLPSPTFWEYQANLRKKYGVELISYGCTATPQEQSFRFGYNKVMKEAIKNHYGEDVFQKAQPGTKKEKF